MLSETCTRCGEETRYGWRDGAAGWWHRELADHNPMFGVPQKLGDFELMQARWFESKGLQEAEESPPIPEPEVLAVSVHREDPRMPQGARNVWKWANESERIMVWATYSRGPRTHATSGVLLSVSDAIVLRMVDRDGEHAVAFWFDGKMEAAYVGREAASRVNGNGLKAWIKGEEA